MKRISTATQHAQRRLLQRGISILEVEDVLNNPLASWSSRLSPGTEVKLGFIRGTEIKIYVRPNADESYHLKSAVFRTKEGVVR
jgi:hypothetical protein